VDPSHEHPPEASCTPGCPRFADEAVQFYAAQRRYPELLQACRTAAAIEWVLVAPAAPGVCLPAYLQGEELVRLNLVVGRDTPEVLLDEWGIRCDLTFRGTRSDCALPWSAVVAGRLRPPERKRPRFGVIAGGKKD